MSTAEVTVGVGDLRHENPFERVQCAVAVTLLILVEQHRHNIIERKLQKRIEGSAEMVLVVVGSEYLCSTISG